MFGLQAAVEVGAEEAARLAELSKQLSKETAELAKLRASCDGLQKKAAALQVRVPVACTRVPAAARGSCLMLLCLQLPVHASLLGCNVREHATSR